MSTLAAAGALALVACSLSLEGYSGGGDATDGGGSTPPGTPPPPNGPPNPPQDAASDAEAGVDPCIGTTFCDLFDTGAFGAKWDVRTTGIGSMDYDTAASVSAPNSVLAVVAPGHTGAVRYLTNHLSTPVTNDIEMELDLRLELRVTGTSPMSGSTTRSNICCASTTTTAR